MECIYLVWLLFICAVSCVVEQSRISRGKVIWLQGRYRNRNVVPRPALFMDKKHKRGTRKTFNQRKSPLNTSGAVLDLNEAFDVEEDDTKATKKSHILGKHFSLPIGAMLPIGFSSVTNNDDDDEGTKKSKVPRISFADQLSSDPSDQFQVVNLKEARSRSNVPESTLDLHESKKPRDENGYERSLGGKHSKVNIKDIQISDEDLDGLMRQGLSGNRGRERNEILLPSTSGLSKEKAKETLGEKFQRREFPTGQLTNFTTKTIKIKRSFQGVRRYLHFPYHTYHYHHHHHHPHYHLPPPYPPPIYVYPPNIHIHLHPTPPPPPPPTTKQPSAPTAVPPAATTTPPPATTKPPAVTTKPPGKTTKPPGKTTKPPGKTTAAVKSGTKLPIKTTAAPQKRLLSDTDENDTLNVQNETTKLANGTDENIVKTEKKNDTEMVIQKLPLKSSNSESGADLRWFDSKGVFDFKQNSSVKNPQYNNGEHEMLINYGQPPDGEFDQDYPFQPNGNPMQYQNHDWHHNVPDQHPHAPYYLHKPHDDYKNIHPGHPNEEKMKSVVKDLDVKYKLQSSLNLTNIRSTNRRNQIPTPRSFFQNVRQSIRNFLSTYGQLYKWERTKS